MVVHVGHSSLVFASVRAVGEPAVDGLAFVGTSLVFVTRAGNFTADFEDSPPRYRKPCCERV